MKHEFAILPWEYRGSGSDRAPHALAQSNVTGQERDFLLKMREGIIYFKEPKRTPMFGVLRQFGQEMHGDNLIEAWRKEMEQENFGRMLWRPLGFPGTPATTVIVCLLRADFSGWLSDAFHTDWLTIPPHTSGGVLDVWERDVNHALNSITERERNSLLNRAMPSSERQTIAERWFVGEEDELRRIFTVGAQLYMRARDGRDSSGYWEFAATNPASEGGFLNSFRQHKNRDIIFSSALTDFLRLLQQHFVLMGMRWKHFNHMPTYADPLRPMMTQWGDEWRGNYRIDTPLILFPVPLVGSLSGHERLELQLQLRNWLEGKVSPRQSANLLANTLD